MHLTNYTKKLLKALKVIKYSFCLKKLQKQLPKLKREEKELYVIACYLFMLPACAFIVAAFFLCGSINKEDFPGIVDHLKSPTVLLNLLGISLSICSLAGQYAITKAKFKFAASIKLLSDKLALNLQIVGMTLVLQAASGMFNGL